MNLNDPMPRSAFLEIDGGTQDAFPAMSAVNAVETCAARARELAQGVSGRGGADLIGVAPDSFRLLLERELVDLHGDADSWLRLQGITVVWFATGSRGAAVDEAGMRIESLEPSTGLMLWVAADEQ
ncbi:hypothetical protein ACIRCZ_19095 [Leifsonia sp. NPDC102414]|uniref:hypothetical protein n=1 Tax=Leifsonia sp. NPDC102414 TaxID=3364124 RepID=UPI003820BAFA